MDDEFDDEIMKLLNGATSVEDQCRRLKKGIEGATERKAQAESDIKTDQRGRAWLAKSKEEAQAMRRYLARLEAELKKRSC